MTLVHVEDRRLDAESREGAHAADAEQDLLSDSLLAVSAVERRRHRAALRGVLRQVAVEQKERDASDVQPPDRRDDVLAGEIDRDLDRESLEPERLGVVVGIRLALPAGLVERLSE